MDPFILTHLAGMDDFWKRKATEQVFGTCYNAFGHTVHLESNVAEVLESAALSAARYCRADPISDADVHMTIIEQAHSADVAVPDSFPAHLHYQAVNTAIALWGSPWVVAHADLNTRTAVAVVSSALVRAPVYLSRFVMDTLTLNMLIHTGVGQLHASCLYRDGRAVLLSAPHNTGKSTTAFGLVRCGYQLVSDGMTYVRLTDQGLSLMGYPVGEIKLRMDVLDELSELGDFGEPMLVREAAKMVYKLRDVLPDRVIQDAITPHEICLCLLEREERAETVAQRISADVALEGLWQDAAHYDALDVLSGNLRALRAMLNRARCYRLVVGTDKEEIARVVNAL